MGALWGLSRGRGRSKTRKPMNFERIHRFGLILEDLEGFQWILKDFHQFWKVFDSQTALDRSQTLRNVSERCQTPCAQPGSNLQASRMRFWSSRTRFLHLRMANPDPIPIYSVYYCRLPVRASQAFSIHLSLELN